MLNKFRIVQTFWHCMHGHGNTTWIQQKGAVAPYIHEHHVHAWKHVHMSSWFTGPRPHLEFLVDYTCFNDAMIMSHGDFIQTVKTNACNGNQANRQHLCVLQSFSFFEPLRDDKFDLFALQTWLPQFLQSFHQMSFLELKVLQLRILDHALLRRISFSLPVKPLHHWFCNVLKSFVGPR